MNEIRKVRENQMTKRLEDTGRRERWRGLAEDCREWRKVLEEVKIHPGLKNLRRRRNGRRELVRRFCRYGKEFVVSILGAYL